MIDLSLYLDKSKKYCVATSGGPDSMALLDLCVQQGFSVYAFHMNYHHRDTAYRDQLIVNEYCFAHKIPLVIANYQPMGNENFQMDARLARYLKAKEVIESNELEALLVAHQQDDVLETYLMQKESKREVNYYGLKATNELFGIKVIRPLLSLTKRQCHTYCLMHDIDFGIDESNLTDIYTRNKIRHHILFEYTQQQRDDLLCEIEQKNKQLQAQLSHLVFTDQNLTISGSVSDDSVAKGLRQLLVQLDAGYGNKSHQYYLDLWRSISKNKAIHLNDQWYLFYDNSILWYEFIPASQPVNINDLQIKDYGMFKISSSGNKRQGFYANPDEFPLMYRLWKDGDKIETKFGTKKVSRWFIDQKIHPRKRLLTHVIENKYGKVIYLDGFGCDYSHYCQNEKVFVIE